MKKLAILSLVFLVVMVSILYSNRIVTGEAEFSQIDDIESHLVDLLSAAGNKNISVYDSSELTAEVLEHRRGTTIVERCLGVVTNAELGDGVVLNAADKNYDYISYRGISWPLCDGAVLLSYMVYNPGNEFVDDIVERYDFILNIEWGRLNEICTSFAE